jgi:hypothetical protein
MSATMSSVSLQPSAGRMPPSLAVVLAAWLIAVLALGANGAFMAPAHAPPLALLVAFVAPIATGVIAYRGSARFREWVLGIEPRVFVSLQSWRFAGFSFIALYVHGILPGFFAWPAGLGDMAIGMTAPWMLGRIAQSPEFAASRAFVRWNLLGLLDLFLAIALGAIGGFLLSDRPVTTAPMATLPLVLIPAFLVPSFILMHFAALAQARRRVA